MEDQTKESKLKTILLGSPEQREARTKHYTDDIKNRFWTCAVKTALIPGYLTNLTLYGGEIPLTKITKPLMTVATLAIEYQRIQGAATIAAKLGEYFS